MKTLIIVLVLTNVCFAGMVSERMLSKPFFGVRLGVGELAYFDLCKSNGVDVIKRFSPIDDKDFPATIVRCNGGVSQGSCVKMTDAYIFNGAVYKLQVTLADSSEANYDAVKAELSSKYEMAKFEPFKAFSHERNFSTMVDGRRVTIVLDLQNRLSVTYTLEQAEQEMLVEYQRRKQQKISTEL